LLPPLHDPEFFSEKFTPSGWMKLLARRAAAPPPRAGTEQTRLDRHGFGGSSAQSILNTRQHGGPGDSLRVEDGGAAPADGSHAINLNPATGQAASGSTSWHSEQKGEVRSVGA